MAAPLTINMAKRKFCNLETAVARIEMFPTPTAADLRNRGGPLTPVIQRRIAKGKSIELSMTVNGALNPPWVEWLMGWPIGATDLKALGTDKFHSRWLQPMQSYLTNFMNDYEKS
jgi:hypothetical protein